MGSSGSPTTPLKALNRSIFQVAPSSTRWLAIHLLWNVFTEEGPTYKRSNIGLLTILSTKKSVEGGFFVVEVGGNVGIRWKKSATRRNAIFQHKSPWRQWGGVDAVGSAYATLFDPSNASSSYSKQMGGRWAVAEYRHDRGSFNSHRHKIADVRRRCHLPLSQVDEVENEDNQRKTTLPAQYNRITYWGVMEKPIIAQKSCRCGQNFTWIRCVHDKFSTHDTDYMQ